MLFLAFDLVINDRKKLVLSLETSGMTKSLKICLLGKTDYFCSKNEKHIFHVIFSFISS